MKTATEFKQKAKVGVSGSFINQMMGNNSTLPVVGEGATVLHYSDRTPYQVIEVSEDFKTVKIQEYSAKAAVPNSPMGHQDWVLEPTEMFRTIVWRNGSWKQVSNCVDFTKEFRDAHKDAISFARLLTEEQRLAVYGDSQTDPKWTGMPAYVVDGITKPAKKYSKISIIFGHMDYYYDYSF